MKLHRNFPASSARWKTRLIKIQLQLPTRLTRPRPPLAENLTYSFSNSS